MRIAILDGYFDAARHLADWSQLSGRADVQVFTEHPGDEENAAKRLADFEIIVGMRERTPFPATLIRRLDNVLLTPHLGYVSVENLTKMYQDAVEDITAFPDGKPVRILK